MLTQEQLWRLRKQIRLCSLYYSDYENDMGINSHDCCDFFDGYAEYLGNRMESDGHKDKEFFDLLDKYDTPDNLYDWYGYFEDDPLPTEYIECEWCHELLDESELKREINMGFLCSRCIDALWSRGEKLYLEV